MLFYSLESTLASTSIHSNNHWIHIWVYVNTLIPVTIFRIDFCSWNRKNALLDRERYLKIEILDLSKTDFIFWTQICIRSLVHTLWITIDPWNMYRDRILLFSQLKIDFCPPGIASWKWPPRSDRRRYCSDHDNVRYPISWPSSCTIVDAVVSVRTKHQRNYWSERVRDFKIT